MTEAEKPVTCQEIKSKNSSIYRGEFKVGPLRFPNIMKASIRQALYSIKGITPVEMKISGNKGVVKSPLDSDGMEGIMDDYLYIAANLSEIVFKCDNPNFEEGVISLKATTAKNHQTFRAEDLDIPEEYGISIVDRADGKPNNICVLDKAGHIDLRVKLKRDHDRRISSSIKTEKLEEGWYRYKNVSFTPIETVAIMEKEEHIGKEVMKNLTYTVTTDGSVSPADAMRQAFEEINKISASLVSSMSIADIQI